MSDCRHLRAGSLAALVSLLGINVQVTAFDDSPTRNQRFGTSPWLTVVLAAELPKYQPHNTSEVAELSESSVPAEEKDGVLALPTLTVRPVIKESPSDHALLTEKGRRELALKAYPGLRIGNIFGLNNGIALVMQAEEQQVRNSVTLYHRLQRTLVDDSPESRETMRLLESALGRHNASWLKNSRE